MCYIIQLLMFNNIYSNKNDYIYFLIIDVLLIRLHMLILILR